MIGGVGICIRTLTHSAITFLMDFLWYILFFYLVRKTGTPFILYFHTPHTLIPRSVRGIYEYAHTFFRASDLV